MFTLPPEALLPIRRRHRGAFTVIELLATIAIAVTLATLLTVGAGRFLKSAKQSQSLSNLRVIQQGISSFQGENDGRYPYNSAAFAKSPMWTDKIEPYLPDKEASYPDSSDKIFKVKAVLSSPLLDYNRHHKISDYGVNNAVLLRESDASSQLAAAVIAKPSQTVTVMSAQQSDGGEIRGTWYVNTTTYIGGSATTFIPSDHGLEGAILCVFADGHTESIPTNTFFVDRKKYLLPNP